MDYVDSCVFLSIAFEEGDALACKTFVNTRGYRQHPRGIISHLVVSEIFVGILEKVQLRDALEEERVRLRAMQQLSWLFTTLLEDGRMRIARFTRRALDLDLFDHLKALEYSLSDDDAFHLVAAVAEGCDRFVTKDRTLVKSERVQTFLKRHYGLSIIDVTRT